MREFKVLGGRIIQGGVDEVRQFYAQARAQPSDDDEQVVMIVNVARR